MPAIRSQRTRRRIGVALSYAAMLTIVAFAVFPILWALLVSLKPESEIVSARLTYLPRTITFENYVAIWTRSNFPALIVNSAVVTAITVAICTAVGTLAAYAIARYRFRGRTGSCWASSSCACSRPSRSSSRSSS